MDAPALAIAAESEFDLAEGEAAEGGPIFGHPPPEKAVAVGLFPNSMSPFPPPERGVDGLLRIIRPLPLPPFPIPLALFFSFTETDAAAAAAAAALMVAAALALVLLLGLDPSVPPTIP